ncbi:MAG: hypothetical protein IJR84_10585 [Bacteroidaceae bacterium]|nr:hypothetical protein [Bacteroidaceae bacterium]
MGGNGAYSKGMYDRESERDYRTEYSISKNIKVIALKNPGSHNKMPRTSHTENRVYVTMRKDGSGISDIARYGKDHRKQWSIHTAKHKSFKHGHVHYWKNGEPTGRIDDINQHPRLKRLLDKIMKLKR